MRTLEVSTRNREPFRSEVPAPVRLDGKRILVFGGAGTLGKHFCYAASRAGAELVIAERDERQEPARSRWEETLSEVARNCADLAAAQADPAAETDREAAEPPLVLLGDITDHEDAIAIAERAASHLGAIDIVIDLAGLHHPPFDLLADDPTELAERFRKVTDVNLTGAFFVTMAAARVMAPQRYGHIIHLCSNGSRLSLYGSYAYNASKHGLEGLVKTAAAQLAPFGVRVNGIAPGTVETDLNRDLLRDEEGNPRPRARSILAHTPTKRFATIEGVMQSLLAMCIEQPHLTGNVLFADDGYNIEGHSWPEGTDAVYGRDESVDELYRRL